MQAKYSKNALKHFLCVASNLAFAICDRLIQIDDLPIDDCVFMTTRNYRLPICARSYHVVETALNTSVKSGRLFAGWRIWETKKNLRKLDQLIYDNTGGEDFLFYTQICNNDLCSAFVTNPHCKGYYIIEDGSGSYRNEEIVTFQGWRALMYKWILKPLYPRIYTLKSKMVEVNHPKFRGCIATNEMCFPLHQDVVRVIGLPFHPEPLEHAPQALISLDPYYLWLTDEQVQRVMEQLGAYINTKHYQRIVFKPHPYLLTEDKHSKYVLYKEWIQRYIHGDLEELGGQVSLENTLMAHRDCIFYTAVSSVAIYAKAMGVTCYTFAPLLRQFCDLSVPVVEDKCIPINPE